MSHYDLDSAVCAVPDQRTPWAAWSSGEVKKLADYGRDDHPADDPERAQVAWAVAVLDDCDECGDLRVELTVEEVGSPGSGLVAHLSMASARQLRTALTTALRDVGEDTPGAGPVKAP